MKTMLMATGLAGLMVSGSATAANGNKLLEECQAYIRADETNKLDDDDLMGIGHCLGFVEGVYMTLQIKSLSLPVKPCFPENGLMNGQSARIFVKYLKAHPEDLHKDATYLLNRAYDKAFPCKK